MKILITGATGFLGSHLVRRLSDEGHHLIILKRSSSCLKRIEDIIHEVSVFNIDKSGLEEPFKKHQRIDTIIHLATNYGRNGESPTFIAEVNYHLPLKLLELAESYKVKLFVNTDTFFNKSQFKYNYLGYYTTTKRHFVELAKIFVQSKQIKFINIKLEHLYGPRDNTSKFVPFIIANCLNNVPELRLTAGKQRRDFIYVDDVVNAYLLLLKKYENMVQNFQEYELGTGRSVTIEDFVTLVHSITNSKTFLKFGEIPYRDDEIMDSSADVSLLKKMGWEDQVNLAEGIKKVLIEDYSFDKSIQQILEV